MCVYIYRGYIGFIYLSLRVPSKEGPLARAPTWKCTWEGLGFRVSEAYRTERSLPKAEPLNPQT